MSNQNNKKLHEDSVLDLFQNASETPTAYVPADGKGDSSTEDDSVLSLFGVNTGDTSKTPKRSEEEIYYDTREVSRIAQQTIENTYVDPRTYQMEGRYGSLSAKEGIDPYTNPAELERRGYMAQSSGEAIGNTFKGLLKNTVAGFIDNIATIDPNLMIDSALGNEDAVDGNVMSRMASWVREWAENNPVFKDENQTSIWNWRWFGNQVQQLGTSIGIVLESFAEQALLAAATGGFGNAATAGELAVRVAKNFWRAPKFLGVTKAAGIGFYQGLREAILNAQEAGRDVYQKMLQQGYTEQEAKAVAAETLGDNFRTEALFVGALNAIQTVALGSITKMKPSATVNFQNGISGAVEQVGWSMFGKIKSKPLQKLAMLAFESGSEAIEEGVQTGINKAAIHSNLGAYANVTKDYASEMFDDGEFRDSMIGGMLGGLLFGALGGVRNIAGRKMRKRMQRERTEVFNSFAQTSMQEMQEVARKMEEGSLTETEKQAHTGSIIGNTILQAIYDDELNGNTNLYDSTIAALNETLELAGHGTDEEFAKNQHGIKSREQAKEIIKTQLIAAEAAKSVYEDTKGMVVIGKDPDLEIAHRAASFAYQHVIFEKAKDRFDELLHDQIEELIKDLPGGLDDSDPLYAEKRQAAEIQVKEMQLQALNMYKEQAAEKGVDLSKEVFNEIAALENEIKEAKKTNKIYTDKALGKEFFEKQKPDQKKAQQIFYNTFQRTRYGNIANNQAVIIEKLQTDLDYIRQEKINIKKQLLNDKKHPLNVQQLQQIKDQLEQLGALDDATRKSIDERIDELRNGNPPTAQTEEQQQSTKQQEEKKAESSETSTSNEISETHEKIDKSQEVTAQGESAETGTIQSAQPWYEKIEFYNYRTGNWNTYKTVQRKYNKLKKEKAGNLTFDDFLQVMYSPTGETWSQEDWEKAYDEHLKQDVLPNASDQSQHAIDQRAGETTLTPDQQQAFSIGQQLIVSADKLETENQSKPPVRDAEDNGTAHRGNPITKSQEEYEEEGEFHTAETVPVEESPALVSIRETLRKAANLLEANGLKKDYKGLIEYLLTVFSEKDLAKHAALFHRVWSDLGFAHQDYAQDFKEAFTDTAAVSALISYAEEYRAEQRAGLQENPASPRQEAPSNPPARVRKRSRKNTSSDPHMAYSNLATAYTWNEQEGVWTAEIIDDTALDTSDSDMHYDWILEQDRIVPGTRMTLEIPKNYRSRRVFNGKRVMSFQDVMDEFAKQGKDVSVGSDLWWQYVPICMKVTLADGRTGYVGSVDTEEYYSESHIGVEEDGTKRAQIIQDGRSNVRRIRSAMRNSHADPFHASVEVEVTSRGAGVYQQTKGQYRSISEVSPNSDIAVRTESSWIGSNGDPTQQEGVTFPLNATGNSRMDGMIKGTVVEIRDGANPGEKIAIRVQPKPLGSEHVEMVQSLMFIYRCRSLIKAYSNSDVAKANVLRIMARFGLSEERVANLVKVAQTLQEAGYDLLGNKSADALNDILRLYIATDSSKFYSGTSRRTASGQLARRYSPDVDWNQSVASVLEGTGIPDGKVLLSIVDGKTIVAVKGITVEQARAFGFTEQDITNSEKTFAQDNRKVAGYFAVLNTVSTTMNEASMEADQYASHKTLLQNATTEYTLATRKNGETTHKRNLNINIDQAKKGKQAKFPLKIDRDQVIFADGYLDFIKANSLTDVMAYTTSSGRVVTAIQPLIHYELVSELNHEDVVEAWDMKGEPTEDMIMAVKDMVRDGVALSEKAAAIYARNRSAIDSMVQDEREKANRSQRESRPAAKQETKAEKEAKEAQEKKAKQLENRKKMLAQAMQDGLIDSQEFQDLLAEMRKDLSREAYSELVSELGLMEIQEDGDTFNTIETVDDIQPDVAILKETDRVEITNSLVGSVVTELLQLAKEDTTEFNRQQIAKGVRQGLKNMLEYLNRVIELEENEYRDALKEGTIDGFTAKLYEKRIETLRQKAMQIRREATDIQQRAIDRLSKVLQTQLDIEELEEQMKKSGEDGLGEGGEREKDLYGDSTQENNKALMPNYLKLRLMSLVSYNGDEAKVGIGGMLLYEDFDTVVERLVQVLLDNKARTGTVPSTIEGVMALLENATGRYPWINNLLISMAQDSKLQKQFVSNFAKHAMKVVLGVWEENQLGGYTFKLIQVGEGGAAARLRSAWSEARFQSTLYSRDRSTGKMLLNREEAANMLKEFGDMLDLTYEMKGNQIIWMRDGKRFIAQEYNEFVEEFLRGKKSKDNRTFRKESTINQEKLVQWLSKFGINLDKTTMVEMFESGLDGKSMRSMFQLDSDSALIGNLIRFLSEATQLKNGKTEFEYGGGSTGFSATDAFSNISGLLKSLSELDAKNSSFVTTRSFRDGDKSVNGFTNPILGTDMHHKIMTDKEFRKQLLRDPFMRFSFANRMAMLGETDTMKKLGVEYLGNTAFRKESDSNGDRNSMQDLSDKEELALRLGFLMDSEQGFIKSFSDINLPYRVGRILFPNMSDKTRSLVARTMVLDLSKANITIDENGNVDLSTGKSRRILNTIVDKLLLPELNRIATTKRTIEENRRATDGRRSNIDETERSRLMIHMLPMLNNVRLSNGMRLIEYIQLQDQDAVLKQQEQNENGRVVDQKLDLTNFSSVRDEVMGQIAIMLSDYINSEIKAEMAKITTTQKDGSVVIDPIIDDRVFNDNGVDTRDKEALVASNKSRVQQAIMSLVINELIGRAEIFQSYIGDPAFYAKDGKLSKYFEGGDVLSPRVNDAYQLYSKEVVAENMNKRLAEVIAPGIKLAVSKEESSQYLEINLNDVEMVSQAVPMIAFSLLTRNQYEDVVKQLEEYRKSKDGGILKRLGDKYPTLAPYLNVTATDAQEYSTLKEHLQVLNGRGLISDEVMKEYLKRYQEQLEDLAKGREIAEEHRFTEKELGLILQPMKPVYTGMVWDGNLKAMRKVYLKTSSIPLIPQVTIGTEMDGLRRLMEQTEKRRGMNVRAVYHSGAKVGFNTNAITPFTEEGKFDEGLLKNDDVVDAATLQLDRNFFRIQQDVPYKSAKHSHDTISMVTQMAKLLFSNGAVDLDFVYEGKKISGRELWKKYNDAFGEYMRIEKQNLYKELYLDSDGTMVDPPATMRAMRNLLKEEIAKRGLTDNDLISLDITPVYGIDQNGKRILTDMVFRHPLWLSQNAQRFETVMNSIITNRLLKMKMPGYSFVTTSSTGRRVRTAADASWADRIIHVGNHDGNLRPAEIIEVDKNGFPIDKEQTLLAKGMDDKFTKLTIGSYVELEKGVSGVVYKIDGDKISVRVLTNGQPALINPTVERKEITKIRGQYRVYEAENADGNLVQAIADKQGKLQFINGTLSGEAGDKLLAQYNEVLHEESEAKKSGQKYKDDEGRYYHLQKTEVMIPSKFRDKKGKLIEFIHADGSLNDDYVYKDKDGKIRFKDGMIAQELFSLTSCRIPVSSHASMAQIEIVGILPPEAGDVIIVPENLVTQKGLDFDIDKEYLYMLNSFINKEGKIQAIREFKDQNPDDLPANFRQLQLQNIITRIHSAILSNPSPEMQSKIVRPIGMEFAKEQAALIGDRLAANETYDNFSMLSGTQAVNKRKSGAIGRKAIGIFSNYVTLVGQLQALENPVELYYEGVNGTSPYKIQFGTRAIENPILGMRQGVSEDLKYRTQDGWRTIAEVFMELQNMSTDNAKEELLGKLNINEHTINVMGAMALLGIDTEQVVIDGEEQRLSIPFLLLSQPIIQEYVRLRREMSGTVIGGEFNAEQEAYDRVMAMFHGDEEGGVNPAKAEMLTARVMYDQLGSHTDDVQLAVLNAFRRMAAIGEAIHDLQRSINLQSSGMGQTYMEGQLKYEAIANLKAKMEESTGLQLRGITQLLGDFVEEDDENQPSNPNSYYSMQDANGHTVLFKPKTQVGHFIGEALDAWGKMWEKQIPYGQPIFRGMMDGILNDLGIPKTNPYTKARIYRKIMSDFRSYMLSNPKHGLWGNRTVQEARLELMYDTVEHDSLAGYIQASLMGQYGREQQTLFKNNPLIAHMVFRSYDSDNRGLTLRTITVNNDNGMNLDVSALSNVLATMLEDNRKLEANRGKPMSMKTLAKMIVAYAVLEGGQEGVSQLIKYVPLSYFNKLGFGGNYQAISMFGLSDQARVFEDFTKQFIQNNIDLIRGGGRIAQWQKDGRIIDSDLELTANDVMFKKGKIPAWFQLEVSENEEENEFPAYVTTNIYEKAPKITYIDGEASMDFETRKTKLLYRHVGDGRYEMLEVLGGPRGIVEYDSGRDDAEYRIGLYNHRKEITSFDPASGLPLSVYQDQNGVKITEDHQSEYDQYKGEMAVRQNPYGVTEGEYQDKNGNIVTNPKIRLDVLVSELLRTGVTRNKGIQSLLQLISDAGVLPGDVQVVFEVKGTDLVGKSQGIYSERRRLIVLDPTLLEAQNSNDLIKALTHELTHAITAKYVMDSVRMRDGEAVAATMAVLDENGNQVLDEDGNPVKEAVPIPQEVQDLITVFNEAREAIKAQVGEEEYDRMMERVTHQDKLEYPLTDFEKRVMYGLSSIHEFMTLAMTEQRFQEALNIESKRKGKQNLYQRFVKAVQRILSRILGLDVKPNSIIEEAIHSTFRVMERASEQRDNVVRQIVEEARQQEMDASDIVALYTKKVGSTEIFSDDVVESLFSC